MELLWSRRDLLLWVLLESMVVLLEYNLELLLLLAQVQILLPRPGIFLPFSISNLYSTILEDTGSLIFKSAPNNVYGNFQKNSFTVSTSYASVRFWVPYNSTGNITVDGGSLRTFNSDLNGNIVFPPFSHF